MNRFLRAAIFLPMLAVVLPVVSLVATPLVYAHTAVSSPSLGTAGYFAVLGSSTVTNTGMTNVTGDLGVSPGTAVTGFPPGMMNGTIHGGDAVALQAQHDASFAYTNIAGQPCTNNLTGQDLGGKTLTPGVYCFASSAFLTGTLTLDGQGNANSVFIFQMGSTLITASNASVMLINGAKGCNIFWQVGSSATLGTYTSFAGNILALASITVTTGTASNGGLYALNGAVTLDTNQVQTCAEKVVTCSLSKNVTDGLPASFVGSD
jgi:Ice-binding-like